MAHENASSQSLTQLVEQINSNPHVLLLPEFQRDFVWELDQTYALFDSLIRKIFIGSIIFGKPSFEMTLRKIDLRPRKGKGSRTRVERLHYTEDRIKTASQIDGLKILLDGQQRTTSIYRALRGIDQVFFVVRPNVSATQVKDCELEDLLHPEFGVQGEDLPNCICVPMHFAFRYVIEAPFDDEVSEFFAHTRYGRGLAQNGDTFAAREAFKVFRQLLPKFKTLFEEPRLLSYYLLDMSLDKFTTFFERSNSRGVNLTFTDILAAKVFGKFNLRQAFDDFGERHPGVPVNRELLVRAVAVLTGLLKVEKAQILKELRAEDFQQHWDNATRLYLKVLDYLHEQRYMVALRWLPYDSLLVPLMLFFFELEQRGQASLTQYQQTWVRWWYWACVFSERYTAASNEKIVHDARVLQRVARGEPIESSYFVRLRPVVDDPEQLLSYSRSSGGLYRGTLNLIHFAADGLRDWSHDGLISTGSVGVQELHDHHVYPQGFLRRTAAQQDRPEEVEDIRDSVVNRVLMPRDTNLRVSDKAPAIYLQDLLRVNPDLRRSLESHLIPASLLDDPQQSFQVYRTLRERAEQVVTLIRQETVEAEQRLKAMSPAELQVGVS